MPNILIIGFTEANAKIIRKNVEGLIRHLQITDASTTIISAQTRKCLEGEIAPYILIRHTNLRRAKLVAFAIHRRFNFDVEYEKIHGFFEATKT